MLAPAAAGEDIRQPTARNAKETIFVLEPMRLLVDAPQLVSEKLAVGDNAGAAEAASRRGSQAARVMWKPANIRARETDGWQHMMGVIRGGFDDVAAASLAEAPLPQILALLSETRKGCVDRHQVYRLVGAPD